MNDSLGQQVRAVAAEDPSPQFVAMLRSRVVAATEPEQAQYREATSDVPVFDRSTAGNRPAVETGRRPFIGLVAAAALLVGLWSLASLNQSPADNIDASGDLTTASVVPVLDPDAELLTGVTPFLPAATYRVDSLGTPLFFQNERPLRVQWNQDGLLVLDDAATGGEGGREIIFIRLAALTDPANPAEPVDLGTTPWPASDFSGWLDNLPEGVSVSNRSETRLGGLEATRADLELDGFPCRPGLAACAYVGSGLLGDVWLGYGDRYRVAVVAQQGEAPIGVMIGVGDTKDDDWFVTAERLISTVRFGEVAPNPVLLFPAGATELPVLGGVRVGFLDATIVSQTLSTYGRIPFEAWSGEAGFISNPLDLNGNAINSTDQLIDEIQTNGTKLQEISSTQVGGLEARVFQIAQSNGAREAFLRSPEDQDGWVTPPVGKLWVVEHPDRGLLLITAVAFVDDDDLLMPIVTRTQAMIDSLEFTELG